MNTSYGTITGQSRAGDAIVRFPQALVRDFDLRIGDLVSIHRRRNRIGFIVRFYRKMSRKWVRLLPAGNTRSVRRPQ